MTTIETHGAEDFLKTLRIHQGLDTTEDCKKDLEAIAKDFGRKLSQY